MNARQRGRFAWWMPILPSVALAVGYLIGRAMS